MPNVNDLKKSNFLTQHDVERPMLLTITGYEEHNVARDGAEPEMRWALNFKEIEKPLILNSTNGQIIAAIAGSGDFDKWKGYKIVVYQDENIFFGGRRVGGIRVRAPKGNQNADLEPQEDEELPPEIDDSDVPF